MKRLHDSTLSIFDGVYTKNAAPVCKVEPEESHQDIRLAIPSVFVDVKCEIWGDDQPEDQVNIIIELQRWELILVLNHFNYDQVE